MSIEELCAASVEDAPKSQFSALYKPSISLSDQNKRRETLLSEQKQHRHNAVDAARNIEEFEISEIKLQKYRKQTRNFKKLCDGTMLSEWMLEVPDDLDVSWYMKACPMGKRNIVIAYNNQTQSFSRTGRFEYEFVSALPSGHNNKGATTSKVTILDCIWSPKTKSFYVLDCLIWNGFELINCEAEFRFYWLKLQFAENPDFQFLSTDNEFPFYYVDDAPCEYLLMKEQFSKFPLHKNNQPEIDGVLFYHKQATYTAGRTPLVGWLKVFMLPEILTVPVADEYHASKPEKYVDLKTHIDYSSKMNSKGRKKNRDMEMDIGNFETEELSLEAEEIIDIDFCDDEENIDICDDEEIIDISDDKENINIRGDKENTDISDDKEKINVNDREEIIHIYERDENIDISESEENIDICESEENSDQRDLEENFVKYDEEAGLMEQDN